MKHRIYVVWLLILFAALSGCSAKKDGSPSSAGDASAFGQASGFAANQDADTENLPMDDGWKSSGFVWKELDAATNLLDAAAFHEVRFSKISDTQADKAGRSVVSYIRNSRFELISSGQGDGEQLFLEQRTSDLKEASRLELFVGEEKKPKGRAVCMDAVSEDNIAILFVETAQEPCWQVVHIDSAGKVLECQDVSEGYRGQGVSVETLFHGMWWCDEAGASYVLCADRNELLVFGADGGFVMSHPYKAGQQDGQEMAVVNWPAAFHAPDGSLIFALDDSEKGETRLVWLDLAQNKPVVLASIGQCYLRQFMMSESGQIYYSDSSRLYKWDVRTGRREALFSYLGSDIPGTDSLSLEYVEHVALEDGEILLYVRRRTGTDMYALSDKETEDAEGLTVVDFIGQSYVKSAVASFNRMRDESQKIQYSRVTGDKNDAWTRTLAEFAAGKGPDMLCIWAEDEERLNALCEKGVLADLREYLPQDTLDQIFPGILASGTIDGRLVGLGAGGSPIVGLVSDSLWKQENWTVRDIVGIMEKNPDLEGIFLPMSGERKASSNLGFMALKHLENSEFVDWEKGESHFESEEFQELLEISKKFGSGKVEAGQVSSLIRNGDCISTIINILTDDNYFEVRKEYGDKVHFIGYPGQRDYAGYWGSVFLIVVNAKSTNPAIGEFLQYAVSRDAQGDVAGFLEAREDVVRERIQKSSRYQDDAAAIEEYIQFLRKLGPLYQSSGVVADIVREEAEGYFSGSRDAARTAEIIDNRVQLYLDERKWGWMVT